MAFNRSDFADDTEFERFVLDRLGTHRARVDEPGAIFDVRGGPGRQGKTVMVGGTASLGAGKREELRQSLSPLGFGAAYKVLDMLVEHVLRANGAPAGRLSFKRKTAALRRRPATLPAPLQTHPELWDRLAALYTALDEGRHAVTHRRAQATATGDLEIYDDARRHLDTITLAEIGEFAGAVHGAAELIIDPLGDDRRIGHVAWHLNVLSARHRMTSLPSTDPKAGRCRLDMDLTALDDGQLRLEVAHARTVVEGQSPSWWDLRLHADDRVFVGRWEDVPDHSAAAFDFHPASPPEWLSEEVPAT